MVIQGLCGDGGPPAISLFPKNPVLPFTAADSDAPTGPMENLRCCTVEHVGCILACDSTVDKVKYVWAGGGHMRVDVQSALAVVDSVLKVLRTRRFRVGDSPRTVSCAVKIDLPPLNT